MHNEKFAVIVLTAMLVVVMGCRCEAKTGQVAIFTTQLMSHEGPMKRL